MSEHLDDAHETGVALRALPEPFKSALARLLGERFTTNASVCLQHGSDESAQTPRPPQAVAYPLSTEEVVAIVSQCAEHRVPVIPFGVGSSVEGHVLAVESGVCIDQSRTGKVIDIRTEDLTATVQAGVTREALNQHNTLNTGKAVRLHSPGQASQFAFGKKGEMPCRQAC